MLGAVDVDRGGAATPDMVGFVYPNRPGTVRVGQAPTGSTLFGETPSEIASLSTLPKKVLGGRFATASRDDLLVWVGGNAVSVYQATGNTTAQPLTLPGVVTSNVADMVAAKVLTMPGATNGPDQLLVVESSNLRVMQVGGTSIVQLMGNNAMSVFPVNMTASRLFRFRPLATGSLDSIAAVGTDSNSFPAVRSFSAAGGSAWMFNSLTGYTPSVQFTDAAAGMLGNQAAVALGTASGIWVGLDLAIVSANAATEVQVAQTGIAGNPGGLAVLNQDIAAVGTSGVDLYPSVTTTPAPAARPLPGYVRAAMESVQLRAAHMNDDATSEELLVQASNRLQVRRRDTDATYPVAAAYALGGRVLPTDAAPLTGDFDGDGTLDVAVLVGTDDGAFHLRVLRGR